MARPCKELRGGMIETVRVRTPRRESWRSRATMAICCSISRQPACRCSVSSRRAQSRRRHREGHSDASRILRRDDRAEDGAAGERADLIVGNNVLAHVPDINDFVAGMKLLLKPDGVITMEFPAFEAARGPLPVRHDLSRAFLISVVVDRATRICAPWPGVVRRRSSCRLTAVRCGYSRTTRTRLRTQRSSRVGELEALERKRRL